MALKPRSGGDFPLNRTVSIDATTDEKMKFHARRLAITVTELGRRFFHEGIARMEQKK